MATLRIEGGQRLSGSVDVEGNKNAALPLLAACLLTANECILTNVPRISDVEVMARLILDLGGEVEGIGSTGGVIVASVVIGFAERFTDTYISSHWTMIVSLAAILIVLEIKPSVLFGRQKELEERI